MSRTLSNAVAVIGIDIGIPDALLRRRFGKSAARSSHRVAAAYDAVRLGSHVKGTILIRAGKTFHARVRRAKMEIN